MADEVKAGNILQALRHRHPPPEWAFFAELRGGTGFGTGGRERTMDAWTIDTWPSNKFRTVAYEIKVSRSDFFHEINDRAKRALPEMVAGECLFAMPAGLVKVDEVPEGWGLLEYRSGKMVQRKAPMAREVEPPKWFWVSLARRSADPKPVLPPTVYRGKEISDEDLLAMANALRSETIEKEVAKRVIAKEHELKYHRDHHENLKEVWKVVAKYTGGFYTPNAQHVEEALKNMKGSLSRSRSEAIAGMVRAFKHYESVVAQETPTVGTTMRGGT